MAKKPHTLTLDGASVEPQFYYLNNWTANDKNQIHKGSCPECKFGMMKRGKAVLGQHAVWVGPFESIDLAKAYVKSLLKPVPEVHECCK